MRHKMFTATRSAIECGAAVGDDQHERRHRAFTTTARSELCRHCIVHRWPRHEQSQLERRLIWDCTSWTPRPSCPLPAADAAATRDPGTVLEISAHRDNE